MDSGCHILRLTAATNLGCARAQIANLKGPKSGFFFNLKGAQVGGAQVGGAQLAACRGQGWGVKRFRKLFSRGAVQLGCGRGNPGCGASFEKTFMKR